MKLYSIKNTQTERFNPPFVARDDDDAKETCRKAIIAGRDISLLVELENLELYSVGEFDAITGKFTMVNSFDNEVGDFVDSNDSLIVSLEDIPLPEHIQNMIDKMKEVKE